MANFTFTLEKYHGTKSRHNCPNCGGRRELSRYIDANGYYLADDVGKCNRESKCGYHRKPKEFFADNPHLSKLEKSETLKRKSLNKFGRKKNRNLQQVETEKGKVTDKLETPKKGELQSIKKAETRFDSIPFDSFKNTLGNYRQNNFVQFLSDLFPDDLKAVQTVLQKYYIGTYKDGLTVFWQIDGRGKIRTGKIMRYDIQTGKRQTVRSWIENGETCELKTDWMHKKIKRDFNLKQCFFGEHLLQKEPGKTIAVVEAEKTAVLCAIKFPEMIWLAVGAKGYLTDAKFQVFSGRRVFLFPDADAYSDWKEKAVRAQRKGIDARISNLIETHGTDAEKQNGFDLADYLIAEQKLILVSKTEYESFVTSPYFEGWTNASLF
jgi:hypothetical protein